MREGECKDCGAKIYVAATGLHYKWVTNPKRAKYTWHCNTDPRLPVKGHSPKELVDA